MELWGMSDLDGWLQDYIAAVEAGDTQLQITMAGELETMSQVARRIVRRALDRRVPAALHPPELWGE